MEQWTVKDFAAKVRDKKDLYEAIRRNGYHLPSLKSSITTESYLLNIMEGSTYCPKQEDVRLRACPRPPPKEVLVKKFLDLMKAKGVKSHGIDETHFPEKRWLIEVISTLKPDDEIFRKDYLPPSTKKNVEEQKTIQVPKDFLKDLPESKSKVKRRRLKVIGEGVAKQRLTFLRQAVKDMNVAIMVQKVKVERFRNLTKAIGVET
jgi:hypothetical protein